MLANIAEIILKIIKLIMYIAIAIWIYKADLKDFKNYRMCVVLALLYIMTWM